MWKRSWPWKKPLIANLNVPHPNTQTLEVRVRWEGACVGVMEEPPDRTCATIHGRNGKELQVLQLSNPGCAQFNTIPVRPVDRDVRTRDLYLNVAELDGRAECVRYLLRTGNPLRTVLAQFGTNRNSRQQDRGVDRCDASLSREVPLRRSALETCSADLADGNGFLNDVVQVSVGIMGPEMGTPVWNALPCAGWKGPVARGQQIR